MYQRASLVEADCAPSPPDQFSGGYKNILILGCWSELHDGEPSEAMQSILDFLLLHFLVLGVPVVRN